MGPIRQLPSCLAYLGWKLGGLKITQPWTAPPVSRSMTKTKSVTWAVASWPLVICFVFLLGWDSTQYIYIYNRYFILYTHLSKPWFFFRILRDMLPTFRITQNILYIYRYFIYMFHVIYLLPTKKRGVLYARHFCRIQNPHVCASNAAMPDSQTDLVSKAQVGLQAPENQVFEPQKFGRRWDIGGAIWS